jgi:MarR family transcriptional regulator, organic hydroperoxide resistance regulator
MKPEETIDYHVRAVWYGIFRMYNQIGLEHDISTSLGFVLLNIHSEGTPATKIAPLMGMESRSLSRMLKSMEEKGLIYKKQDEADRRSVRIFLTDEGKRRKEISRKTVLGFNEKIREVISIEDLETFFRVMTTVNKNLIKT